MYKSKFFTILVIAFIVLGCTPKIASQTSGFITDQPLLTLDEINPERTISPHTTATSPITPEQARTSTHSPSATNTATLDLTNTLTPESILDASEVQIESITRLGRGVVKDVAWSPDDGTIAVAGHFGIDFYDADTLQLSRTLDMKSDVIQYSPDGKRMAFAYGSEIFLLDLVSGQVIRKFSSEISWFYQVAFNPEGNWLGAVGNRYECASPGADVFEIWDLDIGKLVSFGDIGSVDEFAFSPDGDSLAFDIYDAVWMVDPATGGFIKSFESLRHPFAFTPDWKSIVGVTDSNGIEVRDIETNQVLQSITTEEYYFYDDFILSPNGRLLIIPYVWARSKEDYETLTVDLQTGEINFGLNIDYFVSKAAFNSDGSRLAAVDWNNKKVDIWDLRDDTLVNSIEYSKAISDLAFLPISNGGSVINYRLAAAYENGSVWLWDVGNQLIIQRFEGHEDRVNMISIDVSGEFLASASNDYTARVWSITKGTELHTIEFDESYVQEAIFNPGDTQLLTNSDGLIQIWDTRSWDLLFEYARGWGLVQAQFLNNNQVIGFTYGYANCYIYD
jgi:WD40 repeat protein